MRLLTLIVVLGVIQPLAADDVTVLRNEARRTNPDFVVYVPGDLDRRAQPDKVQAVAAIDRHNVHFIVTVTPSGTFLGTWTQADELHGPNQRVVVARSLDRGRTWSVPTVVDHPEPGTENIASWSFFVVVPHTGRVYCFYHKNIGLTDFDRGMTGVLAWRVSDDDGVTWGERFETRIARGAIDHPDKKYPSNWVPSGWQAPIVNARGQVICPITRWASATYHDKKKFGDRHHEAWFLRFDNIMTETDPTKLVVTTWPRGDHGIRVPHPAHPRYSAAMEPTIQNLSDGRILCLLRTMTGFIYYSVSSDFGESWSKPDVLRFVPGGPRIEHPNAPCPFFKLRDGRYVLFFHNNAGTANKATGVDDWRSRNPVWTTVGREIHNPGGQPIMFGKPKAFYENGGEGRPYSGSLALYGSFVEYAGVKYWWYPDAMRFLLGKVVPEEQLDDSWLAR